MVQGLATGSPGPTFIRSLVGMWGHFLARIALERQLEQMYGYRVTRTVFCSALFATLATGCAGGGSVGGEAGASGSGGSSAAGGSVGAGGGSGAGGAAATGGRSGSGGAVADAGAADTSSGAGSGGAVGAGGRAGVGGSGGTGGSAPRDAGAGDSGPDGTSGGYSACHSNPCKILPLGDSITFGVNDEGNGGYRGPLFADVIAAGQKITFTGSLSNGPTTVSGQAFSPKE